MHMNPKMIMAKIRRFVFSKIRFFIQPPSRRKSSFSRACPRVWPLRRCHVEIRMPPHPWYPSQFSGLPDNTRFIFLYYILFLCTRTRFFVYLPYFFPFVAKQKQCSNIILKTNQISDKRPRMRLSYFAEYGQYTTRWENPSADGKKFLGHPVSRNTIWPTLPAWMGSAQYWEVRRRLCWGKPRHQRWKGYADAVPEADVTKYSDRGQAGDQFEYRGDRHCMAFEQ